jgi:RNA polymerase sigma-70 factor (ECF subfamily)
MRYQDPDMWDSPTDAEDDATPDRDADPCSNDDTLCGLISDASLTNPTTLPAEVTDEVVRFYSPLVWKIALTKTRSSHDAQDIFQDVFVKLVMHEQPFDSEEHRKAWLIRVTINCCNSHFVAPWRKNVDGMDDLTMAQLPDEDTLLPENDAPDVCAEVLKLPQQMREVVLLFYYEEMSIREIADVLGTSEVNVKKRLSRARQKLRLLLENGEES